MALYNVWSIYTNCIYKNIEICRRCGVLKLSNRMCLLAGRGEQGHEALPVTHFYGWRCIPDYVTSGLMSREFLCFIFFY